MPAVNTRPTESRIRRFTVAGLLAMSSSGARPPGYLSELMAVARGHGRDPVSGAEWLEFWIDDAPYRALKHKYRSAAPAPATSRSPAGLFAPLVGARGRPAGQPCLGCGAAAAPSPLYQPITAERPRRQQTPPTSPLQEPPGGDYCAGAPGHGPGTNLARYLHRLGIRPTAACSCREHICQMDYWGPAECRRQMEQILVWLRLEAQRRHLPFIEAAARALVMRAIQQAERPTPGRS